MTDSQNDDDLILLEFYHWIKGARSMGSDGAGLKCNRPFIPNPKLHEYFQDLQRVKKLLRALFPEQSEPPVSPDEIQRSYRKVFFILLLISKGRYIRHFVQHGTLADHHLPFDPGAPPGCFPSSPAGQDFLNSFCTTQWEFCTPIFEDNMTKSFNDKEILPITYKEILAGGGSATTYKVDIHPAYNHLNPESNMKKTALENQHANTYVVKTYETREAEQYYTNEVSAFRKLRYEGSDPNIIGYHGSFTQSGTYNIILEYADKGTLEEYFQETTPPSKGEDILKFWRGIFKILNALQSIHNVPRGESGGLQYLQGLHQDVKPANILIKSSATGSAFDCLFKLADLGLSHFTRTVLPMSNTASKDMHGTKAYGAPECYRVNELVEKHLIQAKPSVDVYSLGCVFSEAAMWLVRGWVGLDEYRRRRRNATEIIPNFSVSDGFHDGEKTLPVVHEMHENLTQDCARSDHVTEAALERIIKDMLEEEALRPTARVLSIKSERILSEADKQLRNHARKRYSGDAHFTGRPQILMDDRPQTPPQIPGGYHQTQPRTPQRREKITHERGSSPESIAYSGIEKHRSGDDFDLPVRKHSPRDHDSAIIATKYNTYRDDRDRDLFLDSSSTPSHLGWDHPRRHTSKTQEHGLYESNYTQSHIARAGTSPVPNPGNKFVIDQDLAQFEGRERRQDGSNGNLAPKPGRDISGVSRTRHNGRENIHDQSPDLSWSDSPELPKSPALTNTALATTPVLTEHEAPPFLSVADAKKWKMKKKAGFATALPDGQLLNRLNKRDHVFLIDDSLSMKEHRQEVYDLFELLGYMVKDLDPNGIELHFTISGEIYQAHHTKSLKRILEKKTYQGTSNIRWQLGNILQTYKLKLEEPTSAPLTPLRSGRFSWGNRATGSIKSQNIYVFTDGAWEPESDPTDIIADLVGSLKQHNVMKERFGIQFIRFGSAPEGITRLDHLDCGLNLSMDVVDTEPSDGNVWKMLHGPVSTWFDGDHTIERDDSGSMPARPTSTYTNGFH